MEGMALSRQWWEDLLCCGLKSKAAQAAAVAVPVVDASAESTVELLDSVPLLRRLSKEDRQLLATVCQPVTFEVGSLVIRQGDIGSAFFVITDGQARVTKSDGKAVELKFGDFFGENALLFDEPRMATVVATTQLATLKIAQQDFKGLGLHVKLQFPRRRAVGGAELRKVEARPPTPKSAEDESLIRNALWSNDNLQPILEQLDMKRVDELISLMWSEQVSEGAQVITVGESKADYFYIVKEGHFEVTDRCEMVQSEMPSLGSTLSTRIKPLRTNSDGHMPMSAEQALNHVMEPGSCFGELALLYLTPRTATVAAADGGAVVWVLDRQNFKRILMENSQEKIGAYAQLLDHVELLNVLAAEEKQEVALALVEMHFTKDEVILQQGDKGSTFYILYEGAVSVCVDGEMVRQLEANKEAKIAHYFGEKALLTSETRTATVRVTSATASVLALDHAAFVALLGPLADIMREAKAAEKRRSSRRMSQVSVTERKRSSFQMIMKRPSQRVEFDDLRRVGLLGNGGFGSVELYEHKLNGQTYALKTMGKGYIMKVGMQHAVVNERNVLLATNSPFIVKLYAAYNWPKTLVLVLELLLGGELYDTYVRHQLFGREVHARYYSAAVVVAFEHMHGQHILYRDLKPENIVLNARGVPKLVDMGLAKWVVGKTYTTCGTPDYFAPEVITGGGHNHAVDWWALGILIFELLAGSPPFTAASPMQIFKKVLAGIRKVALPKKCQGSVGHLLKALLKREPSERLPMRSGGLQMLRKHDWYAGFEWEELQGEQMEPPYKPDVKHSKDLANFRARPEEKPRLVSYHDDGSGWDAEFAT